MTDARTAQELKAIETRLYVLEQKLDTALRTIALMAASTQPAIEWMDTSLTNVDDPRKIGVPRK